MKHSLMANLSKKVTFSRRKIYRIALYLIFIGLCSALVIYLIQCERSTIEEVLLKNLSEPLNSTLKSWIKSTRNYYVAAVIDYEILLRTDVTSTWKANIQQYTDIIIECGNLLIDIVVFPEGGIHGYLPVHRQTAFLTSCYVPSAKDLIVPCNHKDYRESPLHYFSCAAKRSNIYVAVSVVEKVYSNDPSTWDGHILHITEVVFDRNGMVIERYRKFNVYTERWAYGITPPDKPDFGTFVTDFGVEFGLLTCFDIFFEQPAAELMKSRKITHFIHSSAMITRLPFLPVTAIESGWSYALDLIVLSSSIATIQYTIGTNIFFGRRVDTRTYIKPFRSSNIIISLVPKNRNIPTPKYPDKLLSLKPYTPGKPRQTAFLVEHVLDQMSTQPLSTGFRTNATYTYRTSTFECNISASWKYSGFVPNFQFIAYSGLNNASLAAINNYSEMCGIVLCSRNSLISCQQPPKFEDASGLIFTSANISTRSISWREVRIPAIFDSDLVNLDGSSFDFNSRIESHVGKIENRVDMRLKRPTENLFSFSVYKFGIKANPATNFNIFDNIMNSDMIF